MADPTGYTPSYNFTDYQDDNPTVPLPAPQVDNELDNISQAIEGLVNAIKNVRRSDGALKNASVTPDTLSAAVLALIASGGGSTDLVAGPSSSVDGHFAQFDGITGDRLKDGKAAPAGAVVGTTDTQTLTNKTITSPLGIVATDVGAVPVAGGTMTGGLGFSGTANHGLGLSVLNVAQRDALVSPQNGWLIYNSTTDRFNGYAGGAWKNGWVRLEGDTMTGDLIVTYSNPSGPVRQSVGNTSSGGSASATRDMFTGLANSTMLESLNNSGFFSRSFGSAVVESYDNCDGHIWRTQAGTVKASLTGSLFDVKTPETITSTSANALAVGANGSTNPALQVDASTASSATGLRVKSAAAAGGVAISVLSSGTNEDAFFDAKGSGQIKLGYTSTGFVQTSRNLIVGIGSGARYVRANGGNTTNGGSAFLMDLGGSFDSGFGHKSAILGGAFDPTAMLYVAGGGTMELRAGSQTQASMTGGNVSAPNGALIAATYLKCGSYTVGTVPSASASGAGAEIHVSNESGGATNAFSDGTNWRRYSDRAIIS